LDSEKKDNENVEIIENPKEIVGMEIEFESSEIDIDEIIVNFEKNNINHSV